MLQPQDLMGGVATSTGRVGLYEEKGNPEGDLILSCVILCQSHAMLYAVLKAASAYMCYLVVLSFFVPSLSLYPCPTCFNEEVSAPNLQVTTHLLFSSTPTASSEEGARSASPPLEPAS